MIQPPTLASAISALRNCQSDPASFNRVEGRYIMTHLNRRTFLGTSAALAAGLALADVKKQVSANEKVVVALIGCGGMGRADLHDFMRLPDFEIAALCDVDPGHAAQALADIQRAKRQVENVQVEK